MKEERPIKKFHNGHLPTNHIFTNPPVSSFSFSSESPSAKHYISPISLDWEGVPSPPFASLDLSSPASLKQSLQQASENHIPTGARYMAERPFVPPLYIPEGCERIGCLEPHTWDHHNPTCLYPPHSDRRGVEGYLDWRYDLTSDPSNYTFHKRRSTGESLFSSYIRRSMVTSRASSMEPERENCRPRSEADEQEAIRALASLSRVSSDNWHSPSLFRNNQNLPARQLSACNGSSYEAHSYPNTNFQAEEGISPTNIHALNQQRRVPLSLRDSNTGLPRPVSDPLTSTYSSQYYAPNYSSYSERQTLPPPQYSSFGWYQNSRPSTSGSTYNRTDAPSFKLPSPSEIMANRGSVGFFSEEQNRAEASYKGHRGVQLPPIQTGNHVERNGTAPISAVVSPRQSDNYRTGPTETATAATNSNKSNEEAGPSRESATPPGTVAEQRGVKRIISSQSSPSPPAKRQKRAAVPVPANWRCTYFNDQCENENGDASNWRKCWSDYFGRNKACTQAIPPEAWIVACRKHYQRIRYRQNKAGSYHHVKMEKITSQIDEIDKYCATEKQPVEWKIQFQKDLRSRKHQVQARCFHEEDDVWKQEENPSIEDLKKIKDNMEAWIAILLERNGFTGEKKTTQQCKDFVTAQYNLCEKNNYADFISFELLPTKWKDHSFHINND